MADWYLIPKGTILETHLYPVDVRDGKTPQKVRFDQEVRVVDTSQCWGDKKDHVPFCSIGKVRFALPKALKIPKVKIPPMSREFLSLAVKDSVWEFERDWTFQGYDGSTKKYTVPAGTQITIADNKMKVHYFGDYHHSEKAFRIKNEPTLAAAFQTKFWNSTEIEVWVPAKEASGYLKLVKAGKTKTYWKLLKSDGSALTNKNFANLGNAKSSARYHFGMIKSDDDPNNYADQPDYWVASGDYNDFEKADLSEGVIAVQYDHATKTEIAREDLSLWLVMSKMKTS